MSKNKKNQNIPMQQEAADEEMTVTLDLEDGSSVTCAIVTILTVQNQDYIVLLPLEEDGENHDGMVWFYRYFENENDPNEEPVLEYIEDDELVEVTPLNIRLRKILLTELERRRQHVKNMGLE